MPAPTPAQIPEPAVPPAPEGGSPGLRVCVVGTGYVGLVTGAGLSTLGHAVECIDRDAARIAALREGRVPFHEPGLPELLVRAAGATRPLAFAVPGATSIASADLVFLAVGTPAAPDGESADLGQLFAAADAAAGEMRPGAVLVVKSTVPAGTCDAVQALVHRQHPGRAIAVASNPEFLREGRAVEDFLAPSRLVIGCDDPAAEALLRRLYAPLLRGGAALVATTRKSAELIKYASNGFLATKLAFINEMADLCEQVGADVEAVAQGMGLDPRIGPDYLRPGPGHGGSCLPKDLIALSHTARQHAVPLRIVDAVQQLNAQRRHRMVEKIGAACGGGVEGRTIALLGAAFKPDTDDVRESPALALAGALAAQGAIVRITDPQALRHVREQLPGIATPADPYACARQADAVVLVTAWAEYVALDLPRLRASMRGAVMVDLRNAFEPAQAAAAGFRYVGLGRPAADAGGPRTA